MFVPLTLHWDSKPMIDLTGKEKVERLPIKAYMLFVKACMFVKAPYSSIGRWHTETSCSTEALWWKGGGNSFSDQRDPYWTGFEGPYRRSLLWYDRSEHRQQVGNLSSTGDHTGQNLASPCLPPSYSKNPFGGAVFSSLRSSSTKAQKSPFFKTFELHGLK